ncbi:MAG TPA: SRPBCC domain-containing protein [Acidimicrobiales bacterium]|nr:SRPBCC domain-containing protein [Acidimicrobiales bacterium]
MSPNRHGSSIIEFPSELEIVTTRCFDAPIGLVFDVLTKPEHVRQWCATGGDEVTICEIDLRVGGDFHTVFVTPDGGECSFRGTYLEIVPPTRLVNSWLFEGWPDAWAVETNELSEVEGVTTLAATLAFRDKAGRAHMARAHEAAAKSGDQNGQSASYDAMEDLLTSLLERGGVS